MVLQRERYGFVMQKVWFYRTGSEGAEGWGGMRRGDVPAWSMRCEGLVAHKMVVSL